LQQHLSRFRVQPVPGLPPFQGGAAGLLGYDLCHYIERLPRPRFNEFGGPDLAVGFYDWTIAFDHLARRGWIVATGLPEQNPTARRRRAEATLHNVAALVQREPPPVSLMPTTPVQPLHSVPLPGLDPVLSNFDRATYLQTAQRAIDYIHAGDCFQVNIAQRLLAPATLPPLELYRRLRERNPAPFAAYHDLGSCVLASASPERFLHMQNGEIETRPIKGTRRRGQTPEEEVCRIAELQHSPKDRAENVMIVDLLRNDLGRVCEYGSVQVPVVCGLETYRYVHHLVSVVRGRLRPELGVGDLLRATFPGGSVTGAPKVRAMEIIAELEPHTRGAYCGCMAWFGFDGSMDSSILIRTFNVSKGWVQFPVGGGIVADSVPEDEYAETLHKAEGLLRALHD